MKQSESSVAQFGKGMFVMLQSFGHKHESPWPRQEDEAMLWGWIWTIEKMAVEDGAVYYQAHILKILSPLF